MKKKVFKPDYKKKESRMSLASNEAVVMKRLISALRALWRSTQNKGLDSRITDLKSYLCPSPPAERQGSTAAPALADRSSSAEEGLESDHGSGEAMVSHSDSDTSHGDDDGDEEYQSDGSLNAPTLQLGDPSPATQDTQEDGSDSDSVSGGDAWLQEPHLTKGTVKFHLVGWENATWLRMPVCVQRLRRNVATINLILGSGVSNLIWRGT